MKHMMVTFFYLLFCAFVLYGTYHIIFVLGESKWWALAAALLLSGGFKFKED